MLVNLPQLWFSQTTPISLDKIREISGKRYRAGVHKLHDNLYKQLPMDTLVVEPPHWLAVEGEDWKPRRKGVIEMEQEKGLESRAMDQLQEQQDEAEKNRKEIRAQILVKAREAKAKKKQELEDLATQDVVEQAEGE